MRVTRVDDRGNLHRVNARGLAEKIALALAICISRTRKESGVLRSLLHPRESRIIKNVDKQQYRR